MLIVKCPAKNNGEINLLQYFCLVSPVAEKISPPGESTPVPVPTPAANSQNINPPHIGVVRDSRLAQRNTCDFIAIHYQKPNIRVEFGIFGGDETCPSGLQALHQTPNRFISNIGGFARSFPDADSVLNTSPAVK